jgi:hypothetical protein
MVGVGVGFEHIRQLYIEPSQVRQVALDVVVDRVDEHRGAAGRVNQQIGERRGAGVE